MGLENRSFSAILRVITDVHYNWVGFKERGQGLSSVVLLYNFFGSFFYGRAVLSLFVVSTCSLIPVSLPHAIYP